jgi:hypothetical protein
VEQRGDEAFHSFSAGSGLTFGVFKTSNDLVSFVSSGMTRGARWRRARNSSCDAGGWCAPDRSLLSSMKSAEMSMGVCERALIEDLLP